MNRKNFTAFALVLAALSAGSAIAADHGAPKTRAQVRAELAEAVRTGDIVVGEAGEKANELYPGRYPAKPAVAQGLTREQVKAELAEAVRTGDIVVGEAGEKANELYPGRYPAKPAVAQGLTRQPFVAKPAASTAHGEFNGATGS